MKKKLVSSMLVAAMAASLLAGCGSSSSTGSTSTGSTGSGAETSQDAPIETDISKMPVVHVMCPTAGVTDNLEAVTAAINEILAAKYGIQCTLQMENFGSYSTQLNLMLTTPGEVDVFELSGGPNTYANNGMIYDITELWETKASAEWKALFKDEYIEANKVDGKLYAVPSNINFSNEILVHANKQMIDEMGIEIDDEKIWTLDEIHDLVKQAMEAYPEAYGIAPQSGGNLLLQLNWESLGDSYHIGVVENRGESREVISITDCQEFIDFAKTMREWYQEGLIMQDVLTTTESWSTLIPSGRAFCCFDAGAYPNGQTTDDSKFYNLTIYENWSAANCAVRMGYGIAGNTENAEAAFTMLQAMYVDKDICNLLSWGIEGENYVVNESGKADFPEGVSLENDTWTVGHVANWALPNMMGSYLSYASVDGAWDNLKAYDAAAQISGCMGVVFDSTNCADEYTACINAYQKYYPGILAGVLDTDTALAEYKAELKAAGEDVIIAAKQEQINAKYGN